ncbi:hypothetical protein J2X72_005164 [Phyllobacterium sp. 1468]|nr:hypothetical protein [Phyllobacterium sp. 1468]
MGICLGAGLPGLLLFGEWSRVRVLAIVGPKKHLGGIRMTSNGGIELHLWIKVSIFVAGAAAGVAAALIIAQVGL